MRRYGGGRRYEDGGTRVGRPPPIVGVKQWEGGEEHCFRAGEADGSRHACWISIVRAGLKESCGDV